MTQRDEFFNIDDTTSGIARELGPGLNTRIYAGEQAMLSVVTIAPNAKGELHKHPEEQWGLLLEGSVVRVQADERISVKKGDFWRTPGDISYTPSTPALTARGCLIS